MAEQERGVVRDANGTRVTAGPGLLAVAALEKLHPMGCLCFGCCPCGSEICCRADLHLAGNEELRELHVNRYQQRCRDRAKEIEEGGNRDDLAHQLAGAGVPADAITCTYRHVENQLTEAGKRFMQAPRDLVRMLVLTGSPGIGKTVAAAILMAEWLKRAGMWNEPSGGVKIRRAVWLEAVRLNVCGPEELNELRRTGLLVLDDVGRESTDFGKGALIDVVFARHGEKRPTILTSNLKRVEVRDRYQNDALMDRFRESAIWPELTKLKSLRRGHA